MAIAIDNSIKSIAKAEFNGTNLTKIYCDDVLVWSAFKDMTYEGEFTSANSINTNFSNGISLTLMSEITQNSILDEYLYTLTWRFRHGSTTPHTVNFSITPKITNETGTITFDSKLIQGTFEELDNYEYTSQAVSSLWLGNKSALTLNFTFSGTKPNSSFTFNAAAGTQTLKITAT